MSNNNKKKRHVPNRTAKTKPQQVSFPCLINHLEQAAQGEKATSFEVGQEKDLAGSEKSDTILI